MSCTLRLAIKIKPIRPYQHRRNQALHDIPISLLAMGTIGIMLRPTRKGEEPAARTRRCALLTPLQHK